MADDEQPATGREITQVFAALKELRDDIKGLQVVKPDEFAEYKRGARERMDQLEASLAQFRGYLRWLAGIIIAAAGVAATIYVSTR